MDHIILCDDSLPESMVIEMQVTVPATAFPPLQESTVAAGVGLYSQSNHSLSTEGIRKSVDRSCAGMDARSVSEPYTILTIHIGYPQMTDGIPSQTS